MKKLLLFSFTACALLSPLALSAQKKAASAKIVPAQPVLKTQADTVSYALGVNMVQNGLTPYLTQMGVIADTAAVRADYTTQIEKEADVTKKSKLSKELNSKLDSLIAANTVNLTEFLIGFSQTIKQDKSKSAFNSGVAIGSQLSTMTENFSKEVLGGEGRFNVDAFVDAFSNSLKGDKLILDNAEEIVQEAVQRGQAEKEAAQAEEAKAQYAAQIAEGDKFMAENKAKADVITLPSGLQYKVITEGTGAKPTVSDRVTVHYKGTMIDGTTFDSSIDRGEPATFGVSQVIKGWTEALLLMPVGSKWILYIPYDLAYGSRDQGVIKPFSNLIFEVELIDIEK
ncbi:FKBP-type peptidyl-prolyl cis-trans isomerase [Dysgonomonas sp. Marseille-P4677]|uniref:FKBP-type peptidyl-prolyl cis-trans isomerase n=1 Tax=Dysgonomonas sp. Marseille-P4677 TaxID=2364790 RepID=UPI00191255EC|nr:FKBP-type peptidyl-prolyl cis-trans isomerase [Dysgonomonas sp. Marseille-P4677]MBK5719619.1 FKBP-type peptidyl-prolyl cis-trans isomerase [Dysgonomonas sp. Marseille-P4677]